MYNKLAAVAADVMATCASQAYVHRTLSLCGTLTSGRRNHMKRSVDMLAFLKLGANIV